MRTTADIIVEHAPLTLESLIPLLQDVQEGNGFLAPEAMEEIAAAVKVPVSKVFGVATFYRQFRFAPLEEHVIHL